MYVCTYICMYICIYINRIFNNKTSIWVIPRSWKSPYVYLYKHQLAFLTSDFCSWVCTIAPSLALNLFKAKPIRPWQLLAWAAPTIRSCDVSMIGCLAGGVNPCGMQSLTHVINEAGNPWATFYFRRLTWFFQVSLCWHLTQFTGGTRRDS